MSEPKYLIVFPDCLVAPGRKTVGTWTLSRVTGNLGTGSLRSSTIASHGVETILLGSEEPLEEFLGSLGSHFG